MPVEQKKSSCCCPACAALECLERPKFQAGQILTEADLNSLENYVVAKNRLHNRYLHGPGVVCGAQVVCHECEGWVRIMPGYGIDYCGNDVIVCEPYDLNLIKAIRECCEDRYRKHPRDCEPYRPRVEGDCTADEQHWCIAIEYKEREARPIAPLRTGETKGCSACGCTASGGCGCGGRKTASQKNGSNGCCATAPAPKKPSAQPSACEPTRIVETFKVCVFEEPAKGCPPGQTLFDKIVDCFRVLQGYLTKRVPPKSQQIAAATLLARPDTVAAVTNNPQDVYTAYLQSRQALFDLFTENPFGVRCRLMQLLRDVEHTPPGPNDTVAAYTMATQLPAYNLAALLVMYVIDCICMAILPACAPEPCDNRLVLACVTVRGGKVESICNYSCRTFAGAFPSMFHWLSVVPLVPALQRVLKLICCSPDLLRRNSPLVNDVFDFFKRIDPDNRLRESFFDADFALPKWIGRTVAEGPQGKVMNAIQHWLTPKEVNLGAMVGQNVDAMREHMKRSGVNVIEREVENEAAVPFSWLAAAPYASRGDQVVAYRAGNKVVGFGAAKSANDVEDLRSEVAALRDEVRRMRAEK